MSNLNNVNWKTILVPIVASGALVYGTISGHEVSASLQNQIVVDSASLIAFAITVWGFYRDHKKGGTK